MGTNKGTEARLLAFSYVSRRQSNDTGIPRHCIRVYRLAGKAGAGRLRLARLEGRTASMLGLDEDIRNEDRQERNRQRSGL